jgi:3-phosphoshikimate 1-carboxyvinyltransferase
MSLAVASLVARGDTQLADAAAAAVSYPGFWDDLARLRH